MTIAHINRIGTAVPENDIHLAFTAFARTLLPDNKTQKIFDRMAERTAIEHRYSILAPGNPALGQIDSAGLYRRGRFPGTAARMAMYETHALALALEAIDALGLPSDRQVITHLIVASCTGFTAPGLDLQLSEKLGLRSDVQRTIVGFMGCSAAVPALRLAHQAVRSDPAAQVLVVNLELCSLHLQESSELEPILSFMLFGDGCSAALISGEPSGIALRDFVACIVPDSRDLITWHIGDQGFDMHLSGQVPGRITQALRDELARGDAEGILHGEGTQVVDLWAIHGGGNTVLDAVECGFGLREEALAQSRSVLRDYGNMSSATVMFVLHRMLQERHSASQRGLAMAFGPGMVAETFRFTLLAA